MYVKQQHFWNVMFLFLWGFFLLVRGIQSPSWTQTARPASTSTHCHPWHPDILPRYVEIFQCKAYSDLDKLILWQLSISASVHSSEKRITLSVFVFTAILLLTWSMPELFPLDHLWYQQRLLPTLSRWTENNVDETLILVPIIQLEG